MHRNPWWLTPAGPTLDAGAFLVGLEWASGRRARIVGKPSPAFFATAVRRLASEAAARGERPLLRSELAMVGDDVDSDIGGGRRSGLRTIFVRTGKHGDAELAAVARSQALSLRAGRGRGIDPGGRARPVVSCVRPASPGRESRLTRSGRAGSPARARHPHVVDARPRRSRRPAVQRLEPDPDHLAGPGVEAIGRGPPRARRTALPGPRRSQTTVCVPSSASTIARRWSAADDDAAGWANSQRNVSRWPAAAGSVIGAERTVVRPSRS